MKKVQIIVAIIVGLIAIGGTGWKFYDCKADKVQLEQLAGNFEIYKLEQYRQALQQRIWQLQRAFPNNYQQHPEYQQLVRELQQVDMKLNAYYQRGK